MALAQLKTEQMERADNLKKEMFLMKHEAEMKRIDQQIAAQNQHFELTRLANEERVLELKLRLAQEENKQRGMDMKHKQNKRDRQAFEDAHESSALHQVEE